MAETQGRTADPLIATARAADPRLDYRAFYKARVLQQSGDLLRLDVEPEDKRLPAMSDIPIKHGVPGAKFQIAPGAFVMVGWENADPSLPYVSIFDHGAGVLVLSLLSQLVNLGAENLIPLTNGVVLGRCVDPFTGKTHAMLGGASLTVCAKD